MIRLGETLRTGREKRGMSTQDVASQIKISERQIRALEAEDFAQLPNAVFVRGFVRSYAKLLGLDVTSLLATLPDTVAMRAGINHSEAVRPPVQQPVPPTRPVRAASPAPVVAPVLPVEPAQVVTPALPVEPDPVVAVVLPVEPTPPVSAVRPTASPFLAPSIEAPFASNFAQRRRQNMIWLAAAILCVLAAIGFAAWNMYAPASPAKPILEMTSIPVPDQVPDVELVSGAVSAPVMVGNAVPSAIGATSAAPITSSVTAVAPVVVPVSAVNPNAALRLVFDEDSWTEIREQSGRVLTSQLNRAGTELSLDGTPPFTLIIGNATGVNLYYHGVEVDLEQHLPRPDSSIARFKLE